MACANESPPLLMPWFNITVSQDQQAWSRGLEVGIGTPLQILSLRPSLSDVVTWVNSLSGCKSVSNDTCIGQEGGVFDTSQSSTYHVATASQWNGSTETGLEGTYFNDYIAFGDNGSSYGFPMLLDAPEFESPNGLGLGAKSTFLDVAVSSGSAPSRSWGLWTGSRSVMAPVDGLLIIGGYDTARIEGETIQFTSFQNCQTCTVVTSMTYDGPNGSIPLFSGSRTEMEIVLDPYSHTLSLPQDVFDNFGMASRAYYNPSYGWTYPLGQVPSANLTVTLTGGYKTTIPSQELFGPPREYNSQGVYAISNDSLWLAEVQNGSNPKYPNEWGIPYLTMNYLKVYSDEGTFEMAPAYRTDFGAEGGALVQKLCTGLAPTATTSSSTASSTATSTATGATNTNHPVPSGSNTGAIVGGVVGGVLGLALIAAFLWFLIRKGRKRSDANSPEAEAGGRDEEQSRVSTAMEVPQSPHTTERNSKYFSGPLSTTTETTHTELESPGVQEQKVNQWLSVQQQGAEENKMKPSVSEPFEMPTYPEKDY